MLALIIGFDGIRGSGDLASGSAERLVFIVCRALQNGARAGLERCGVEAETVERSTVVQELRIDPEAPSTLVTQD
jgi:hypothetical protein